MTTKKEKLRELTWGYFWKRKIAEFSKFFKGIFWIFIVAFPVPFATGLIYCKLELVPNACSDGFMDVYVLGMTSLLLIAMFGGLIFAIFYIIYNFIKSNWKNAEEDAKDQLKKEKRRKK